VETDVSSSQNLAIWQTCYVWTAVRGCYLSSATYECIRLQAHVRFTKHFRARLYLRLFQGSLKCTTELV